MIAPVACARPALAVLDGEEIRLLVSIGFHGALNGKPDAALRLFEALGVLRPQDGFPHIGSAVALMAVGRPNEAARVLEEVLTRRPDDDLVRVFLGMTLRLANRGHHARAVLAILAERDSDTPIARLARQLLESPL